MKILVLGNFGYNTNKLDGQTIKTRNIYELLCSKINDDVFYFDTSSLKNHKFRIFTIFRQVCKCDRLVYLPAHGNLRFLFPIIYFFSLCFGFKIVYVVIGGWLVEFLSNKPFHRFCLKKITVICTETKLMKKNLIEVYSFSNVIVLPNFRRFIDSPEKKNANLLQNKLNVVFMARIQMKKGLDYIEDICKFISDAGFDDKIQIDFYGQVDEIDSAFFKGIVDQYPFVRYLGALLPQQIHLTLSQYDILLLLTHYYTEGFPGTILDAYIAGIPVIVTNWKHAHEFVDDKKTGYIVPFKNGTDKVVNILTSLVENKSVLQPMKQAAKSKSLEFSEEAVWNTLSCYF